MYISTPESKGISSKSIEKYMRSLEEAHLAMHDVVIAKGDSVVFKAYYPPFTPEREHRLYSDTKSLVAIAVGFAIDEGLLTLDDKLIDHFPKEAELQPDENFRALTIRNMLMMATSGGDTWWFNIRGKDRVEHYFRCERKKSRPGGSYFEYDSSGSFVMGALVERLTGKSLVEYLKLKLFDKIGVTGPVRALKAPGGHTWGDSAFLMRPEDLMLVIRFLLNGGSWNGEQLLNREFVRQATSNLISTGDKGKCDEQGYGYYIWKYYDDGFYFNGMGCQFAVGIPNKDIIFVCNADNQGNSTAAETILTGFYNTVVKEAVDELPEDTEAQKSLADFVSSLKLFTAYGSEYSPLREAVNGKTYTCANDNPMGITRFTLSFDDNNGGVFAYTNAQGDKKISFGMLANAYQRFPQTGYSNECGSVPGDRLLDCALSAAWKADNELWLKLQIIDDYFGNMDAYFTFSDNGKKVHLKMRKTAEDFLAEYDGEGDFIIE